MSVVTAANPKEARLVVDPTARTSAGAQSGGRRPCWVSLAANSIPHSSADAVSAACEAKRPLRKCVKKSRRGRHYNTREHTEVCLPEGSHPEWEDGEESPHQHPNRRGSPLPRPGTRSRGSPPRPRPPSPPSRPGTKQIKIIIKIIVFRREKSLHPGEGRFT